MGHRIWQTIKNTFRAIRNGEILLRLKADKFYMHIMYLFLLMWLTIMLSLQVDKTLVRVSDNKEKLQKLRIHHAEKEAELIKLHSASAAQDRLKELGSEAAMPAVPATIIRKK